MSAIGHAHTHDQKDPGHTPDDLCCSHHNITLERYALLYMAGLVLVLSTLVAKWLLGGAISRELAELPALLGAVLLGAPLFWASFQEARRGHLSTSTLAAMAILAAIAIEMYVTAGLLAFILLIADQFVRQRAWGAERAIAALVTLTPDVARVVAEGAERETPLTQVKVGDVVRVRPGENLPVDGMIVRGVSTLNQASLTGEAAPHEVQPGEAVYAGTTNLSSVIELRVTQVGADTTIGKVSQLIREAEQSRTPRQLLVEQVSRFYVPVALSIAFLVWLLTKDVTRAITVLVVSCPAALLLSSPLAMVAAFTSAARLGILVKRTNYLESSAAVDTVVLDKTGTITTGRFAVSRLAPADGIDGAALLQAAANAEQHSNHPLARSILETAVQARIQPDGSHEFEEVHGRGIIANTSLGRLDVGRRTWIVERFPDLRDQVQQAEAKIEGMSGVHVVRDGRYLGAVGLEDRVRPGARGVVARLRELGVRRIAMLTGDRLSVAERVGRAVGVDQIEAECLPEEKHAQIEQMVRSGRRVMMVGDGINDGPSLAAADVGVAMGLSGSDIAANSAGIALMTDDISRIAFLIELARKTRAIVAQNIAASILISLFGLAAAATGQLEVAFGAQLSVLFAAVYHVAADIFVIGNSFRLVRFGEQYVEPADAPQPASRLGQGPAPAAALPVAG